MDEDGFGTEGKKDDSANRLYRGGLPDSLQFFDLTYPCEHKIVDEDGFGARKLRTLFSDNILGSANAEQLKLEQFGSCEKE